MRLKYKLLALAALSIAVTQSITPAKALSKHNVKSFVRWVHSRPVKTLQQNNVYTQSQKHNPRYYTSQVSQPDKHNKDRAIRKDTTVKFSRYNEKALKLILKLYGARSDDRNP